MSERFEVTEGERGIVRLFSLSLDKADHDSFTSAPDEDTPSLLQTALGTTHIDPDFVEVFDVADLEGLGLAGYMLDGLGVSPDQVTEDRARLDGLKGKILVVLSNAFGGTAQTLTPRATLTWIGTYTEDRTPVSFEPLPDGSAQGVVPPGKAPPSDAAMSGRVAMLALLVIFALTVLIVVLAA